MLSTGHVRVFDAVKRALKDGAGEVEFTFQFSLAAPAAAPAPAPARRERSASMASSASSSSRTRTASTDSRAPPAAEVVRAKRTSSSASLTREGDGSVRAAASARRTLPSRLTLVLVGDAGVGWRDTPPRARVQAHACPPSEPQPTPYAARGGLAAG